MDIGKVIGRAGQITWRWKALWLLGLLAALGGGGSGGSGGPNMQFSYSVPRSGTPEWLRNLGTSYGVPGFIALLLSLAGLAVLLGLVLWLISIIAHGGLIAGVQQVEDEGSTSFRRGWRVGVERFWTLLGIDLLFGLFIFVLVGLLVGFIVAVVLAAGGPVRSQDIREVLPAVLLPLLCCGIPLACGVVLLGAALSVIRTYALRAAVLEKHGVFDAIGRGWQVLRKNLGNTFLLLLVLLGIGIGVGWVIGLLGMAIVGPTVFSLMDHTPTPNEIAGLVVGGIVIFLVGLFVNTLLTTFTSAIWTLAYRGFTMPKPVLVAPAPGEIAPGLIAAAPAPGGPTPEETPSPPPEGTLSD